MCGICGVVTSTAEQTLDRSVLRHMCQLLYHRGPDDEGYYFDSFAWLGIRRLSIIDLTTGNRTELNLGGSLRRLLAIDRGRGALVLREGRGAVLRHDIATGDTMTVSSSMVGAGPTLVTMVEAADLGECDDFSALRAVLRAGLGRVLLEGQVGA